MSVVFPAPMLQQSVRQLQAGKRRSEVRTTRSEDGHHLPWINTTRDTVQDDLIVGGDLAVFRFSLEQPKASASAGYDIADIIPLD